MDRRTAAAVLGVDPDSPPRLVRARYRSLVMRAHPDRSSRPDAAERTRRLTMAYRVLHGAALRGAGSEHAPARPDATAGDAAAPAPPRAADHEVQSLTGEPTLLGATTIGLSLPAQVAYRKLLDVALDLGEVTYVDRSSGLLEVIVEFMDAPTSSVVLTVVAQPSGSRIDCAVEPLSGGSAPGADAVTRLLLRTLSGDDVPD